MADNTHRTPSQTIPRFIQSQLDHPPIGPNESVTEFRSLFHELAEADQGGQRSAAEYAMLFQATTLVFRVIGLERVRSAIIQHKRPEAVVALLSQTYRNGVPERGSIAFDDANERRNNYFATKEGRKQVEAQFASAGYGADAVDVEAFELALPSVSTIDR